MKKRPCAVLLALALLLLASVLVSVSLGRYAISPSELVGILRAQLFGGEVYWSPIQQSLLLNHRLPRVAAACLVGACLAAAGASYQSVFQNPIAAPDILGASSGAALGAALAIFLGWDGTALVLSAFLFSLGTVAAVLFIGSRTRGKRTLGLVLAGVMVSSLVSSMTSFIKLVADPEDQLPAITYWLMGSLNGIAPQDLVFAVWPMLAGLVPLLALRWRINVLTLGDQEAQAIGVDARRLRALVVLCATLVTAASVSISGMIGWVGLVIPHFARRIVGNNYRYLLPAGALLGAVFLLWVDDISRNLMATEIPIGILTSFLGAPFFLYLISRGGERI